MNPKRKPFIFLTILFAFVLLILSAIVLGLTLNNTFSKIRRLVIPIVGKWQMMLWEMMFLSISSGVLGVYTLCSAIRARKKDKIVAIVILLSHCIAFGGAIYIVLQLDKLHAAQSKTRQELFHLSNQIIKDGRLSSNNSQFIPPWLDSVQKNDAKCCGIRTFRDWETFWAPLEKTFPKSCCLSSRPNCTTSAVDIVYPDLLGLNIKTDGGCYNLIVSQVKAIILESKKLCSILTVGIGISLVAVSILYLVVFFLKKSPINGLTDEDDSDDDDGCQVPKFPPGQDTWRNLNFYLDFFGGKKKKVQRFPTDGATSGNPLFQDGSSTFQASVVQFDQQQLPPVEYRVDVLSASTILPSGQVTASNQQGQSSILEPVRQPDTAQVVPSAGLDPDTTDQNIKPTKKRLHRHRHRRERDWQENEVIDNPAPQN